MMFIASGNMKKLIDKEDYCIKNIARSYSIIIGRL